MMRARDPRRGRADGGVPVSLDVSSLTVSSPTLVCELDMNQLKGELRRLSMSPGWPQHPRADRRVRRRSARLHRDDARRRRSACVWRAGVGGRALGDEVGHGGAGHSVIAARGAVRTTGARARHRSPAAPPTAARTRPTSGIRSMPSSRKSRCVCSACSSATGSTARRWLVKPSAGACRQRRDRVRRIRRTAHADGSAGATEGCRHDQRRVDAGVVERRHAARVPAEGRKETLPAHDRGSRACYDLEFMDFRPTEEQELLRRTRARVRRNRNPPARPRMG